MSFRRLSEASSLHLPMADGLETGCRPTTQRAVCGQCGARIVRIMAGRISGTQGGIEFGPWFAVASERRHGSSVCIPEDLRRALAAAS